MIYYINSGSAYEEYDTNEYNLDDILARAFVIGNHTCISADVANDDTGECYHVSYRSGKITNDNTKEVIGYISKDIIEKFGVSPTNEETK